MHQHHQYLHERDGPRGLGDIIESFVSAHVPTEPAGPFGNLFNRPTSTRVSSEKPTFSRENGSPLVQTGSPSVDQPTTTKTPLVTPTMNPPSSTPVIPTRQDRPDNPSSSPEGPFIFAPSTDSSTQQITPTPSTTPVLSPVPSTTPVVRSSPTSSKSISSSPEYTSFTHTSPFNTAAPAASSGAAADTQSTSSGMSAGGKAGLAIGILLLAAFIAGLGFYFYRRKRQENEEHSRLDGEKADSNNHSPAVHSRLSLFRGGINAPRLSLRPVTQLFSMPEKADAGALVATSAANARSNDVPGPTWPGVKGHSEPSNPFDDRAEEKTLVPVSSHNAANSSRNVSSDPTAQPFFEGPQPADGQPFPAAVAGSRRNSPPGPGPNNVHRVQLDFKPSMEDELELRAGSLVRLLHEYDDGWALCIRLDRSQQGVVPRTCISKLPVKPRPGPPPGASRGQLPNGRSRPVTNIAGSRGGVPRQAGPPNNGRYRSQTNTPSQSRPRSPAFAYGSQQQARPRANSDAMSARRTSPTSSVSPVHNGVSVPPQAALARKPVPGQAM